MAAAAEETPSLRLIQLANLCWSEIHFLLPCVNQLPSLTIFASNQLHFHSLMVGMWGSLFSPTQEPKVQEKIDKQNGLSIRLYIYSPL